MCVRANARPCQAERSEKAVMHMQGVSSKTTLHVSFMNVVPKTPTKDQKSKQNFRQKELSGLQSRCLKTPLAHLPARPNRFQSSAVCKCKSEKIASWT
jgi:hypothetical protein